MRHLLHHDDAEQTAIANRIVNDAIADGENLFYLIGEIARQERATMTYTFDRKLRRAAGFTWLAARAG